MSAIFFTEATTLEELKTEIVTDLRQRAAQQRADVRTQRTQVAKTAGMHATSQLNLAAEHWERVMIGHPLKGPGNVGLCHKLMSICQEAINAAHERDHVDVGVIREDDDVILIQEAGSSHEYVITITRRG